MWKYKLLEILCIIFPISNLYISFIFKICSLKNKGLVCDLMLLNVIVPRVRQFNSFNDFWISAI